MRLSFWSDLPPRRGLVLSLIHICTLFTLYQILYWIGRRCFRPILHVRGQLFWLTFYRTALCYCLMQTGVTKCFTVIHKDCLLASGYVIRLAGQTPDIKHKQSAITLYVLLVTMVNTDYFKIKTDLNYYFLTPNSLPLHGLPSKVETNQLSK